MLHPPLPSGTLPLDARMYHDKTARKLLAWDLDTHTRCIRVSAADPRALLVLLLFILLPILLLFLFLILGIPVAEGTDLVAGNANVAIGADDDFCRHDGSLSV